MDARELRIDNLVYCFNLVTNEKFIHSIAFDDFEDIVVGNSHLDYIPIPLSEEWLLKFGFEKGELNVQRGNGYDYQPEYPKTFYRDYIIGGFKYRIGEFHWQDESGAIHKDPEESVYFNDNHLLEIKYVHQLQNLYFALTKEELEIKEPVKQP